MDSSFSLAWEFQASPPDGFPADFALELSKPVPYNHFLHTYLLLAPLFWLNPDWYNYSYTLPWQTGIVIQVGLSASNQETHQVWKQHKTKQQLQVPVTVNEKLIIKKHKT